MRQGFDRTLTANGLKKFLSDPAFAAFLAYCRADPSLSIFLRGKTVDVYWEGFVVFHVVVSTGRLQIGSASDVPLPDWPGSLAKLDPALLPEYIAAVKERRADKVATKAPELRFEAGVIRDNQASGSPVVVLDRQIAGPGGKDQLDLMLLDVGSSRLGLAELKVARNKEIGGPVLDQLQRYRDAFGGLRKEYSEILDQMTQLGLVANRNATVDLDTEPILVLMLAGVPVGRLGAKADSGALQALRAADARKRKSPGWDARLVLFPHHLDQSFSIPMSLEDLPTIEEWCARNLKSAAK